MMLEVTIEDWFRLLEIERDISTDIAIPEHITLSDNTRRRLHNGEEPKLLPPQHWDNNLLYLDCEREEVVAALEKLGFERRVHDSEVLYHYTPAVCKTDRTNGYIALSPVMEMTKEKLSDQGISDFDAKTRGHMTGKPLEIYCEMERALVEGLAEANIRGIMVPWLLNSEDIIPYVRIG